MKDNLKLWDAVCTTDPAHTKKANVKGNKLTSIKPQYQILQATKQWGSYGSTWGFKNIVLSYELKDLGLANFKALFYYPNGEFEAINTISLWRDGAQTKIDDEFAKKVETDTLTKCLSKLGFSADVFMGRFDDPRYIEKVAKSFAPKPTLSDDRFNTALKQLEAGVTKKESITNNFKLTQEQINKLK
jgi:hypothetical protein